MLMLKRMTVEVYGEVILSLVWDILLGEENGKSLLVDIFVEEGAECAMYLLTTTVQTVAILPQLLAQHGIYLSKALNGIMHNLFS